MKDVRGNMYVFYYFILFEILIDILEILESFNMYQKNMYIYYFFFYEHMLLFFNYVLMDNIFVLIISYLLSNVKLIFYV